MTGITNRAGNPRILGAFVLLLALIGSIGFGAAKLTEEYVRMAPTACSESFIKEADPYIWLPESVSDIFYGQQVNFHFDMINGHRIDFYGTVHDGKIQDLRCGSSPDPDFNVTMSDLEALKLATSSEPIAAFRAGWRDGSINLEAKDPKWQKETLETLAQELSGGQEEPVPDTIQDFFGQFIEK